MDNLQLEDIIEQAFNKDDDCGMKVYINEEEGTEMYIFKTPRGILATGRGGAEMINEAMKKAGMKYFPTTET